MNVFPLAISYSSMLILVLFPTIIQQHLTFSTSVAEQSLCELWYMYAHTDTNSQASHNFYCVPTILARGGVWEGNPIAHAWIFHGSIYGRGKLLCAPNLTKSSSFLLYMLRSGMFQPSPADLPSFHFNCRRHNHWQICLGFVWKLFNSSVQPSNEENFS